VTGQHPLLLDLPTVWALDAEIQRAVDAIAGVAIGVAVVCAVFLVASWRLPMMKSSGVRLLGTSLVGCIMLYLSAIVWSMTVSQAICDGFNWLSQIGFTLLFMRSR
jgi:hypothetical protein